MNLVPVVLSVLCQDDLARDQLLRRSSILPEEVLLPAIDPVPVRIAVDGEDLSGMDESADQEDEVPELVEERFEARRAAGGICVEVRAEVAIRNGGL